MKTRGFVAAVVAGAALGAGGLSTVASALEYRVSPGLRGGHVRPSAVVYETSGETDYWRKSVSSDVTTKGVVVGYETYDSNLYETTEEHNDISVSPTGVRRRDTVNYWGATSTYSVEDTVVTVDPATGVTVGDFTTTDGCTTGTGVHARPLHSPQPDVVNDSEC